MTRRLLWIIGVALGVLDGIGRLFDLLGIFKLLS